MANRDNTGEQELAILEGVRYPDEEILERMGARDGCVFSPFLPDNVPAMFIVSLGDMTNSESQNFKQGVIKTGLFVRGAGIYVIFNIGGIEFECPINMHLLQGEHYFPQMTEETRLVVNMVAIESSTGIVNAIRAFTLHPTFSKKLVLEAIDQLEKTTPAQVEEDNYGIDITLPHGAISSNCQFFETGV